ALLAAGQVHGGAPGGGRERPRVHVRPRRQVDPLLRPASRVVTVIPEPDPRVLQPPPRARGVEGAPHRQEAPLQEMLGLLIGQLTGDLPHATTSLHAVWHVYYRPPGPGGASGKSPNWTPPARPPHPGPSPPAGRPPARAGTAAPD